VEQSLRVALAEKMILDWDYLPLPDVDSLAAGDSPSPKKTKKKR
jgi:hypothetical protein